MLYSNHVLLIMPVDKDVALASLSHMLSIVVFVHAIESSFGTSPAHCYIHQIHASFPVPGWNEHEIVGQAKVAWYSTVYKFKNNQQKLSCHHHITVTMAWNWSAFNLHEIMNDIVIPLITIHDVAKSLAWCPGLKPLSMSKSGHTHTTYFYPCL